VTGSACRLHGIETVVTVKATGTATEVAARGQGMATGTGNELAVTSGRAAHAAPRPAVAQAPHAARGPRIGAAVRSAADDERHRGRLHGRGRHLPGVHWGGLHRAAAGAPPPRVPTAAPRRRPLRRRRGRGAGPAAAAAAVALAAAPLRAAAPPLTPTRGLARRNALALISVRSAEASLVCQLWIVVTAPEPETTVVGNEGFQGLAVVSRQQWQMNEVDLRIQEAE